MASASPSTILIEGLLRKQGGSRGGFWKNWKTRWFVWHSETGVAYYETEEDARNEAEPLGRLERVVLVQDRPEDPKGVAMAIIDETRVLNCKCSTPAQKKDWIRAFARWQSLRSAEHLRQHGKHAAVPIVRSAADATVAAEHRQRGANDRQRAPSAPPKPPPKPPSSPSQGGLAPPVVPTRPQALSVPRMQQIPPPAPPVPVRGAGGSRTPTSPRSAARHGADATRSAKPPPRPSSASPRRRSTKKTTRKVVRKRTTTVVDDSSPKRQPIQLSKQEARDVGLRGVMDARLGKPPQTHAEELKRALQRSPVRSHAELETKMSDNALVEVKVLTEEAAEWLQRVRGEPPLPNVTPESFFRHLETGVALCELVHKVCGKENMFRYSAKATPGSFIARENITVFLDAIRDLGVPEICFFEPSDIMEGKSHKRVLVCLLGLAKIAAARFNVEPPLIVKYEMEIESETSSSSSAPVQTVKGFPRKGNALDKEVADAVSKYGLDGLSVRPVQGKKGVYELQSDSGCIQVPIRTVRSLLMVRVGGGWQPFIVFVERRMGMTARNLHSAATGHHLDKLKRNASTKKKKRRAEKNEMRILSCYFRRRTRPRPKQTRASQTS